jgi:glycosyltransferase involved in cell wall biosynthesis
MTALPRDFFSRHDQAAVDQLDGKRIALFTSAYTYIVDGVSLTLNRLVSFLEEHGAEVLVFAPTIPDPPIDPAGTLDPVYSIAAPGRPEYRVATTLSPAQRRRLATFDPDLIHIATPDFLGLGGLRLAHRMNVPVVSSYHTHFTSYLAYYRLGVLEPLLWRYLRWFYNQVHHVYVPTPTMADLLGRHGISSGVRLWPRGVETDRFHPRERDLEWRQALGFGDDEVVVSFISRLVAEKGLAVFEGALQTLDRLGVRYRGLVVGDGPARDELEARLSGVRFVGHLRDRDLARAYASSDIFVFPSRTETFGNVTLEAMASGLPTVCANAPGSDALVQSGRTGYLVDGNDTGQFASMIATLVHDPDLRKRMGRAARQEAERYDWPIVLGRIAGYYAEVTGSPVSAPAPAAAGVRARRRRAAVPA